MFILLLHDVQQAQDEAYRHEECNREVYQGFRDEKVIAIATGVKQESSGF